MRKSITPVSVSDCLPVYINGRIKYWTVNVCYDGDLSTNTKEREEWRELYNKYPYEVSWNEHMPVSPLQPVLKPNINIPGEIHLTGYFKYHHENNTSELEYAWRNVLFGAKRARNFRLKILEQIKNKHKEKAK